MNRIFKMTFLQLKKCGVVFTAMAVLLGALPGIMATAERGPMKLNFNMSSYLLFILAAPIIAYSCFSFLNKRNSSDYYHSMAATRKELFFGRLLGGIAWQTIFTVVNCITAIISYKIFAVDVIVDYAVLVRFFLAIYIIALLVMAAFSLAMSLTTGALYNFFGVFVILFLGRLIIEFIIMAITAVNYKIVDYNCVAGVFNKKYNMLWGILTAVGDDGVSLERQIGLASAHIYTLILTVVIICLAAWAFSARRSEIAQARNPRRVEQAMKVVLAVLAFVMCVFIRFTEGIHELPIWGFVMGICLAVIIVASCDFIAKKKHIISSATAIFGCLLIWGIIYITSNKYANFKPVASDIDYIKISVDEALFGGMYITGAFSNGVATEDENSIKFFCEDYNNREFAVNSTDENRKGSIDLYVSFGEGLNTTTVRRNILVTDEFIDVLYNDKNISAAIFNNVPDESKIDFKVMNITSKEKQEEFTELYRTLKFDIERYKPKEYILSSFGRYLDRCVMVQIKVIQTVILPVLESMPESFEHYYKYINDRTYSWGYEIGSLERILIPNSDLNTINSYSVEELSSTEEGKKLVAELFAKYSNHELVKAGEKGDLVALAFEQDLYWIRMENNNNILKNTIKNKVD